MRRVLPSLALLLACCVQPACAQLVDPTEPPLSIRTPAKDGEGEEVADLGPRLESILISPRRRVAVIDGVAVREGRTFKGGKLLQVGPAQVILEKNGQREVLKLYPAPADRDGAQNKRTRQD
jgi:MSHA biogenesis protein MshK